PATVTRRRSTGLTAGTSFKQSCLCSALVSSLQLPVLGLDRLSNVQRLCLKGSPGALGLSSPLRGSNCARCSWSLTYRVHWVPDCAGQNFIPRGTNLPAANLGQCESKP